MKPVWNKTFRFIVIPLIGTALYYLLVLFFPSIAYPYVQDFKIDETLLDVLVTIACCVAVSEGGLFIYHRLAKLKIKSFFLKLLLALILQGIYTYLIILFIFKLYDLLLPQYVKNEPTMAFIAFISIVLSLMVVLIYSSEFFYKRYHEQMLNSEQLQRQVAEFKYQNLKNQTKPHFFFNSLSVLSGLIETNPTSAQQFVEQLSDIYRYLLQHREDNLVSLKEEKQFADSYVALMQHRFGSGLQVVFKLDEQMLNKQLPPGTLQVLLENVIKHNAFSESHPLTTTITAHENILKCENELRPKTPIGGSNGFGLSNLLSQYKLLSSTSLPQWHKTENVFLIEIPLL